MMGHSTAVNPLCALGHVARLRQLTEHGMSVRAIRRAVEDGTVNRPRRDTYACDHIDSALAAAARIGGALTCVSLLREAGVWAGHGSRLHLQVPPHGSRRPDATSRFHWESPVFGMETPWRVSRRQALWQAIHCLDEENAIAALESAIHESFLPFEQVIAITRLAPRRLEDGIRRMVKNSGSGNETIVRLRLQRAGFRVEPQAFVPGMGHGDLLVDDCVGIDVDGRRWHGSDRFAIDRDRDLHIEGLGRHALRLRAAHIHESWPHTLAVIERAVSDARREQRRRSGRVLVHVDDPL